MFKLDQWKEYQCKWLILSAIKNQMENIIEIKVPSMTFYSVLSIYVFFVIYSVEILLRRM